MGGSYGAAKAVGGAYGTTWGLRPVRAEPPLGHGKERSLRDRSPRFPGVIRDRAPQLRAAEQGRMAGFR